MNADKFTDQIEAMHKKSGRLGGGQFTRGFTKLNQLAQKRDESAEKLADTQKKVLDLGDERIIITSDIEELGTVIRYQKKGQVVTEIFPPTKYKGEYVIDEKGFNVMNKRIEGDDIIYTPEFIEDLPVPRKVIKSEPTPEDIEFTRVQNLNNRIKELRDENKKIRDNKSLSEEARNEALKENRERIKILLAERDAPKQPAPGTGDPSDPNWRPFDPSQATGGRTINPKWTEQKKLELDLQNNVKAIESAEDARRKAYAIHKKETKRHDTHRDFLISQGDPAAAVDKLIQELEEKIVVTKNYELLKGWDAKTGKTVYFGTAVNPFGVRKRFKMTENQMWKRGIQQVLAAAQPKYDYYMKIGGAWKKQKYRKPPREVTEQSSLPKSYWDTVPDGTWRKKPKKGQQGAPRIEKIGERPRDPTTWYQQLLTWGKVSAAELPDSPETRLIFTEKDKAAMGEILGRAYFTTSGLLERTLEKQAKTSMRIADLGIIEQKNKILKKEVEDLKSTIKWEQKQQDWDEVSRLEQKLKWKEEERMEVLSAIVGDESVEKATAELQVLMVDVKNIRTSLTLTSDFLRKIGQTKKISDPAGYGKMSIQQDIYQAASISKIRRALDKAEKEQVQLGIDADLAQTKYMQYQDPSVWKPPRTFVTSVEMTTAVGMTQNIANWSRHILGDMKSMPKSGSFKATWDVYDIGRGGATVFEREKLSTVGKIITRLTKKWSPTPEYIKRRATAGAVIQRGLDAGRVDASGKYVTMTEGELKKVIVKQFESQVDLGRLSGSPITKVTGKIKGKFTKIKEFDRTMGGAKITPWHVRQVEKDLGFSLEPYADDIIDALKKNEVTGEIGAELKGINYGVWLKSLTDRPLRERIIKSAMQSQTGKKADKTIQTFADMLGGLRARIDTPSISPVPGAIETLQQSKVRLAELEEILNARRLDLEATELPTEYGYYSKLFGTRLANKEQEEWLISQQPMFEWPLRKLQVDWTGTVSDRTKIPWRYEPFITTTKWQDFQLLINRDIDTAIKNIKRVGVIGAVSQFKTELDTLYTKTKWHFGYGGLLPHGSPRPVFPKRIGSVTQDAPGGQSGFWRMAHFWSRFKKTSSDIQFTDPNEFIFDLELYKRLTASGVKPDVAKLVAKVANPDYAEAKMLVKATEIDRIFIASPLSAAPAEVRKRYLAEHDIYDYARTISHETLHNVLNKMRLYRSSYDWDRVEYAGMSSRAKEIEPGLADFPKRTADKLGIDYDFVEGGRPMDFLIFNDEYLASPITFSQLGKGFAPYDDSPAGIKLAEKELQDAKDAMYKDNVRVKSTAEKMIEQRNATYKTVKTAYDQADYAVKLAKQNLQDAKDAVFGKFEIRTKKVEKVIEEGTYPTGERRFSVVVEEVDEKIRTKRGLLYEDPALVNDFLLTRIASERPGKTRDFLKSLQDDAIKAQRDELKRREEAFARELREETKQQLKPSEPEKPEPKSMSERYTQSYKMTGATMYGVNWQATTMYPAGTTISRLQESLTPTPVYAQEYGKVLVPPEADPVLLPQVEPLSAPQVQYNPFRELNEAQEKLTSPIKVVQQQIPGIKQIDMPRIDIVQPLRQGEKLRIDTIKPVFMEPPMPVYSFQTPVPQPAPYLPGSLVPLQSWLQSIRRKPRKQRIRKRRKRKLWWDVPYQPLGEPWSPKEYVVFTGKEPKKVKKKEKKKGLDDWLQFSFND